MGILVQPASQWLIITLLISICSSGHCIYKRDSSQLTVALKIEMLSSFSSTFSFLFFLSCMCKEYFTSLSVCRAGFLLAPMRSYSLFEFKIFSSIRSWCKLVSAPQWERWSLGAMKVCTFPRFFCPSSFHSKPCVSRRKDST